MPQALVESGIPGILPTAGSPAPLGQNTASPALKNQTLDP
ncbi:hypothetical protein CYA_1829 [Synechococcus sp. JA-3-3Ab]|nr:hypothetical protein CYA_1829 [Synechococcus sp. JA-3-3Ab]